MTQTERKGLHLEMPPLPVWRFEGIFTPPAPGVKAGDNSIDGELPHDEASPAPGSTTDPLDRP